MDFLNQEQLDELAESHEEQYLIFTLCSDYYALEIASITEIVGMQKTTPVPELPEHMKGIMNLRGKIIPVMDVRALFHREAAVYDDRTCIIIVSMNDMLIGLIVDRVTDVVSMRKDEVVPPPQCGNLEYRFIKGIGKSGKDVRLILDCEKLLNSEEKAEMLEIIK